MPKFAPQVLRTTRSVALLLSVWLVAGLAHAALPHEARVPGGIALITIDSLQQHASPEVPIAHFGSERVWVTRDGARWVAVVGIPLSTKPGPHMIWLTQADGSQRSISFDVKPKKYPVQKLTLNKAMVDPPAEVQARIKEESAHLKGVRAVWRAASEAFTPFALPAQGRLSSRYGVGRILNGQPRASHAGLDVAIPTGTPVTASAHGNVLDVGDYYYCGKTVFVDYGNGLLGMHCHLSEITARVGDTVKRGDVLGKSGATGRATGPHLHWSVYLNGTSVDPELLLSAP